MGIIGTVESVWRYPVKSMAGEEVAAIFTGFAGVYGDRLYAFRSSTGRKGFPFFTASDQRQMIRYRPRFRQPDRAAAPPNLAEAQSIPPGANPVYANADELMLDVETPSGKTLALDDPALAEMLCEGLAEKPELRLSYSERSMVDCRPISLLSLQSIRQLSDEIGLPMDKRRFRTNIHLDLTGSEGFAEDAFVGRSLRFGEKVVVAIMQCDPRCMTITLDPETAEKNPAIVKQVAQAHEGNFGIYGATLVEGIVRKGDPVELLD